MHQICQFCWITILFFLFASIDNVLMALDDEQIFQDIFATKQLIPRIFQESSTYSVDLVEVLEKANNIQDEMSRDQTWQKIFSSEKIKNRQLINLEIIPPTNGVVSSRVIDQQALRQWRETLQETLDTVRTRGTGPTLEWMKNELKTTPEKMLTAAIFGLEDQQKKDYLALDSNEKKIEFLREKMTAEQFKKISLEKLGLEAKDIVSKDMFCQTIELKLGRQRELANLINAFFFLLDDHSEEIDLDKMQANLTTLNEGHLNYVDDLAEKTERLNRLGAHLKILKMEKSQIKDTSETIKIKKILKTSAEAISSQTIEKQESMSKLKIIEVPPRLGLFRGMASGDCSTEYSAGYALSPLERNFFIYDEDGNYRGHLATTDITNARGENLLFFHTLTGKDLTAADATTVLKGFAENLQPLGYQGVVIPDPLDLESKHNFPASREVMIKYAKEGENVEIDFPDKDLRSGILDKYYPGVTYDRPHTSGRILASQKKTVHFNFLPSNKNFTLDLNNVSRTDYLELGLNLLKTAQQSKTVARIEEKLGLPPGSIQNLSNVLANSTQDQLRNYRQKIFDQFKKMGFEYQEEKHGHMLYKGSLRAPDAFSDENFTQSIRLFREVLREKEFPGRIILENVSKHWKLIEKSEKITNFFNNIFLGDLRNLQLLTQLQNGIRGFNPEILDNNFQSFLASMDSGPGKVEMIKNLSIIEEKGAYQLVKKILPQILTNILQTSELNPNDLPYFAEAFNQLRENWTPDLDKALAKLLGIANIPFNKFETNNIIQMGMAFSNVQEAWTPALRNNWAKLLASTRINSLDLATIASSLLEIPGRWPEGVHEAWSSLMASEKVNSKTVEKLAEAFANIQGRWTPDLQRAFAKFMNLRPEIYGNAVKHLKTAFSKVQWTEELKNAAISISNHYPAIKSQIPSGSTPKSGQSDCLKNIFSNLVQAP